MRHRSKTIKRQRELYKQWLQFMDADGHYKKEFIPLKPAKVYRRDEGTSYPSAKPSLNQATSLKNAPKYEGEMLEREQKAQEEIAKKRTRVAPLHKSNYIYISDGIDPAGLGRKNEVL